MDKNRFLEFLLEEKIIMFGNFLTKSGRETPYFINTGLFDSGRKIKFLAEFYAEMVETYFGNAVNVLFGPAYKGIPIVTATSMELFEKYSIDCKISFNRKDEKTHGERGKIIGYNATSKDRVLILEDVITSGISIRESIEILKNHGNPQILGVIVSVDRMEKGINLQASARQYIRSEFGIEIFSIVNMVDIMNFVKDKGSQEIYQKMDKYIKNYCVI